MEEKESLQSTEEPSQHLDWGTAVEMEADAVVSPFPPSVQRLSGMDLGANKSPDMEITKQSLLQIPELVFHWMRRSKKCIS
ncbi:myosin-4-like protein [Lates japonicus]|uniref:Myosin-4-like protein n=1 Tax=Lates japonicus TaxID=270547 RepID=A0AAD3MIT8_LATJO|nr:myosin-4-like protein [Lates japonicus]